MSLELFSQINCIDLPYFQVHWSSFSRWVFKLPFFVSVTNCLNYNTQESWFMIWYGNPTLYVLCCQAACGIMEKIYSGLGRGWDVKFSLLECICLQTSKLLNFSIAQNGNGTFYHLGCCLFPTALPAQQLSREGAKAIQITGIFLAINVGSLW